LIIPKLLLIIVSNKRQHSYLVMESTYWIFALLAKTIK